MTGVEVWAVAAACLAAGLVGLVAGALVNTLADRVVGVDEPVWSARQCRACLAPLPVAHGLALGELVHQRVCEKCGKRASLRRPLVQTILPLLFAALAAHALINPGHPASARAPSLPLLALIALGMVVFTSLAFVFVVDLEHRLIYDFAIWPALILILGMAALLNGPALPSLLLGGALSGGIFLLFYGLGWAIYREEALGFGDVKLAALMGVATGWPGVMTALAITVAGGFVTALLLLGLGSANRRAYIPFGVFMVIGVAIAVLALPFPW
jgi:leader peptidase (prepilin peptidase)/N-methyltransferase